MGDVLNRIKYDAVRAVWKVLWAGREIRKDFKSSGEAFTHLAALKGGTAKPEY